MISWSKTIVLPPKPQGFHLVTEEIVSQLPELKRMQTGICLVFLKHTSASLSINENADPSVRADLRAFIQKMVPENEAYFTHVYEGADDMPAHIKSALLGCSVQLPVRNGALAMGTWQGLYLGEHRYNAGSRTLSITLIGDVDTNRI
ncbi:MAG: secondary thiamine-phosphate synthase enzyme YjbQ [Flavobacteriaceae bacterium]|nr:secondary thiamine-phosphate synthase enzyme YjbQ [Flavobacteriaceae bacterium]